MAIKRGRRGETTGTRIVVRLQPAELAELDEWMQGQINVPTRPEAVRRLIALALRGRRARPAKRRSTAAEGA